MTEITHTGTISAIKENIVSVEITQKEACGSCALKDACLQSVKQHIIEVECDRPNNYSVGQKIELVISSKQAFYASVYGYVIPLILVLLSLFLSFFYTKDEIIASLFGLGVLLPYYFLLYLFRNNLKKNLIIKIR